jgi:hypothetical protein
MLIISDYGACGKLIFSEIKPQLARQTGEVFV